METYLSSESSGEEVKLKQVVLKWKYKNNKGVPKRVPDKYGYFVPFFPQLEQILNIPDVLECVDNPLPRNQGVYRTVTDGLFYTHHPVVQEHGRQTLCFTVHIDDVEVCDALKSKANKHNQRLMYWVLGNIHPAKRSTLKAINLLAIVKAKVAKEFGNEPFLRDFVDSMKKLGTEGVVLNINNVPRRFYGVMLFVAADNPASSNLGGFKETHSATRPCRMCMVKSECMCDKFFEDFSIIRKLNEHTVHVQKVEAYVKGKKPVVQQIEVLEVEEDVDDLEESNHDYDSDMVAEKYHDHLNPSINYGVNGKSILSECPGFDVTKCLPQDLLHLLAEGVVEMVCRLVLKDVCFPPTPKGKRMKPLIPLSVVNDIIQNVCDFGHLNVSRPSPIEPSHVKGRKLKQSASQMLLLLYILPFIVFKVLPKKKLDIIHKLIKLVNLCMQFEVSNADIDLLRTSIEDFGNSFVKVYPHIRTLKLHCIVHLITQSRLFGPVRQHACFRFEGMHSKFSQLAAIIRTMKNYSFSAASRHLAARNLEIIQGKETGKYLYDGDKVVKPELITIENVTEVFEILPNLPGSSDIIRVKEFSQHSNKWHEGVAFLIDLENASFGRINAVYIVQEEVIFSYHKYVTKFSPAVCAYEIDKCESQLHAIRFSDLKCKFPLARFSFNFKQGTNAYLLLKSNVGSF